MDDLIELARATARVAYGERVRLAFEEQPSTYPDKKRWRLVVKDRGEVVGDSYAPTLAESARLFVAKRTAVSRDMLHAHRSIDRAAAVLGL